jgi:hypothetical protein
MAGGLSELVDAAAAAAADRDPAAALARVVVAPDGDEYVVGRPDLGVYVVVPEPGAVFIEALRAGQPLAVATARAGEVAGAGVDGEEFLSGLAAAGLLDPPADPAPAVAAAGDDGGRRTREIRWIEGVSPAAARRLFGPVAWSCYGLAAAFVVAVLVARPDLRPSYEHSWWLPDPVLSVLALFPLAFLIAATHEAWHWLAGRAIGVPAIFRISYRGIFLVLETDLTQIVTAPRRRRYGAFLAGMAFDVTVLAVALGLRLAHRADLLVLPGWLDRLLAAVVVVQLLGIIWQWAAVFMRSDGYAVIANALRCHDLYRATWLTTKDRLHGLSAAEAAEFAAISGHDRRVARWFGLLFLAGLVAMGWMLVSFAIPFTIGVIGWVGHNLAHPSPLSLAFWESVAVVALVGSRYAAIPLLAWRERRLRLAGGLR